MAKPIPVDKPPVTTTSHVLLIWNILKVVNNHAPHTTTCKTLINIVLLAAAVVGSLFFKNCFIASLIV